MSDVTNFAASISGFYRKTAVEQLLLLVWYSETKQHRPHISGAQLRKLFQDACIEAPDMSVYLPRLAAKKPPQLIKERGGFRLAGPLRNDFEKRFNIDATIVKISGLLEDLSKHIPSIHERVFLEEALNCYRVKAYRAAIIMVWNLTYDHVIKWVFADAARLHSLNKGIALRYPKKNLVVERVEDLDDLKESELIEAARSGGLLDKNHSQLLRDKLSRRNSAAHPSRIVITQHQADDMISDLIHNVVLKLIS